MTVLTEDALAKELLLFNLIPLPDKTDLSINPTVSNRNSINNHNAVTGFLLAHGYVPDKELYNIYKKLTSYGFPWYLKKLQKILLPVDHLQFTKETTFTYLSRIFNYSEPQIKIFEASIEKILYDVWTTGTASIVAPQFQHITSFKLISGFDNKYDTVSQSVLTQLIRHYSNVEEIQNKFKPFVNSEKTLKILPHTNNKYALTALLNLNINLFFQTDVGYIDLYKYCKSLYNISSLMDSLNNKELLVESLMDMAHQMPSFYSNILAHIDFWMKFLWELICVYQINNKLLQELYDYLEGEQYNRTPY